MEAKLKNYNVIQIDKNQLQINGKGNHPLWEKAIELSDFCSPWDTASIKKIVFKALWDEVNLYWCFVVEDSEIHIDTTTHTKSSINNSDRVELFFRTNELLTPYYCLEIDPTSRIMDFKALPNREFDFDWNWPSKDIEVRSTIEKTYFIVEGAISIASLTTFGLLKEGKIETGIYRAKYNEQRDSTYEPTWITWVDPKTDAPNFHIAASFGSLNLVKR